MSTQDIVVMTYGLYGSYPDVEPGPWWMGASLIAFFVVAMVVFHWATRK